MATITLTSEAHDALYRSRLPILGDRPADDGFWEVEIEDSAVAAMNSYRFVCETLSDVVLQLTSLIGTPPHKRN